jgi:hypothetical protein
MTPVFMFSVFCSTDDTSFHVFGTLSTENMKTGVISGADCRKHENWCHRWSRVPKTQKLVPSVEQSIESMKTDDIGGAEYRKHENWCHRFHVFGILLH